MSLNSRLKKLESRKTTKAPNVVIFRTILDGGNGKPIVRSPGPACICGTEFTHIMPYGGVRKSCWFYLCSSAPVG